MTFAQDPVGSFFEKHARGPPSPPCGARSQVAVSVPRAGGRGLTGAERLRWVPSDYAAFTEAPASFGADWTLAELPHGS